MKLDFTHQKYFDNPVQLHFPPFFLAELLCEVCTVGELFLHPTIRIHLLYLISSLL